MASLQTNTATRLTFIDQCANKTQKVNPATRLGSVTTKSTTLSNERSRSGSRAQLTALYNEAATLRVTDSPPSVFSQHLRQELSTPTQLTANNRAKEAKTNYPVYGRDRQTCATKNQ
ncbi:hypothetical protein FHG87_003274 [Trinorchestia longiramus]|nr:hypothetical protein FHG87_003274 [Trinorchestia longiramus]